MGIETVNIVGQNTDIVTKHAYLKLVKAMSGENVCNSVQTKDVKVTIYENWWLKETTLNWKVGNMLKKGGEKKAKNCMIFNLTISSNKSQGRKMRICLCFAQDSSFYQVVRLNVCFSVGGGGVE